MLSATLPSAEAEYVARYMTRGGQGGGGFLSFYVEFLIFPGCDAVVHRA